MLHRFSSVTPRLHRGMVRNELMSRYTGSRASSAKAVIFDMGGVMVPSPLPLFLKFEQLKNLPKGLILQAIVASTAKSGAWAQLEKGSLYGGQFEKVFQEEILENFGVSVDLRGFLNQIFEKVNPIVPYPAMMRAVRQLREQNVKTALLTNNWFHLDGKTSLIQCALQDFDVVVESCRVGMRKPDAEIFHHTLQRLDISPKEAIFLDDLGSNLKGASQLGIRTIKVGADKCAAVQELERLSGLKLSLTTTSAVPEHLLLPIDRLHQYLQTFLQVDETEPPKISCFKHGQSNPTYLIEFSGKELVLRKKPPGKILASAHAIEREYRIMKAMQEAGVPVPRVYQLCEDESILGTPFYVMEFLEGSVFLNPDLPNVAPADRRKIYKEMNRVLAKIHRVDIDGSGLQDFGKKEDYIRRNFNVWKRQYGLSKTEDIPSVNQLMDWISKNFPQQSRTTIIHGDFRLDNLIFDPKTLEVIGVLDWELSTLGDPLTDLATCCMPYHLPAHFQIPKGIMGLDLAAMNIPDMQEFLSDYCRAVGLSDVCDITFYNVFVLFRMSAISQGVYKRALQGQASHEDSQKIGAFVKILADIGLNMIDSHGTPSKSLNLPEAGGLPISVRNLSPRVQSLHAKVKAFVAEKIIPLEEEFHNYHEDPVTKWTIHPKLELLQEEAKSAGLWNLFLPTESDPTGQYGAGLSNVEYAFLCEEMGKSIRAPEIFNCNAPDTGNMEVLARYGTPQQKETWLKPLLHGKIRSCFGMTEPEVASSDATNICSSIRREGSQYVVNGRKWWTSGAMDPRCKLCIFMGKTSSQGSKYHQQAMILIPMEATGVKIIRPLKVLGSEDPPHGHAEVNFDNVRVPLDNILLGEGRGFEIAQGRLGPGRIHHCMRMIGAAERTVQLMVNRVASRVAFGKPIAAQSSIQQDIAKSRVEIEQCRLLTLKAAHMMDTVGNKVAAPEIAMIKIAAPSMLQRVCDRAMQSFGGMGVSSDTPISNFFAQARTLRLADGPDEVHMQSLARMEFRRQSKL